MLAKLRAIIVRDWLTTIRYRTGISMQFIGIVAEIAAFYYLARAIGPGFRPDGVAYFPFLLVGTALYGFVSAGAYVFVSSIQTAQTTGTMEVLLTTSTPPAALVALSALSAFGSKAISFLCSMTIGLLMFGNALQHPNWPAAIVFFLLTLLLAVGVGMIGAALQIGIQKGLGLIQMVSAFAWFLSGTMFPISALPAPLRLIATVNPMVYSLGGVRKALLLGSSTRDLSWELSILAIAAVVTTLAGSFFFIKTLDHARRSGTLSFY